MWHRWLPGLSAGLVALGCATSASDWAQEREAGAGGAGAAGREGGGAGGVAGASGAGGLAGGAAGEGGAAGHGGVGSTRYPPRRALSPITGWVAERLRAVAARSATSRPEVFMKVGASGTVSPNFLSCFDGDGVDLAEHASLAPTINAFRAPLAAGSSSFARVSLAAKVGESAGWPLSGEPTPLAQELAALQPRFAFVNFGTNDMRQGSSFASAAYPFFDNLARLLDTMLDAGVVPLVTGLNPSADAEVARWVPLYDAVTRGLAESRQIPYLSLYEALRALPSQGLAADGIHNDVLMIGGQARACDLRAEGLRYGYNQRNLLSVQQLDVVHRVTVGGERAPDAEPPALEGEGTRDAPWLIEELPFVHASTTQGAPTRAIDAYPGCSATQDESGPERWYRLQLTAATPLRLMVLDRSAVDVDVHLLSGGLTGAACVERNDRVVDRVVPAGTHHVVVDTFVTSAGEQVGDYLLVVVPCEPGDADCG